MAEREFIVTLVIDERVSSRYSEANGLDDVAPGDFLEREFGWLDQSGISLTDWALVDKDTLWERYIRYLADWAITHRDPEHEGVSPVGYNEFRMLMKKRAAYDY